MAAVHKIIIVIDPGQLTSVWCWAMTPKCAANSTFAIQYLLIMITNGFTITEKLSDEAINQIRETAQLLSIDIGELKSMVKLFQVL